MIILSALVLTVLTFVFIAYPLFKQAARPKHVANDEKQHELYSRRDTTYSMLKELEFDFQSGILTEDDYHDLSARYKNQAISILKHLDDAEKETNPEDAIEKQILSLRRGTGQRRPGTIGNSGKGAAIEEQIEKEIKDLRRGTGRFCPQCGAKSQTGDRFCSQCGASLGKEKNVD